MDLEKVKALLKKRHVKTALAVITALIATLLFFTLGNNIGEFMYFITN